MPEIRDGNRFVKAQLHDVIEGNLDLLWQWSESIWARQWARILLLQFIEYLLKYQVQSHNKDSIKTHDLNKLYQDLTDDDRNHIEACFSELTRNKQRYSKSFSTVKEFVKKYHDTYELFRYKLLQENFSVKERYFYIADTFLVLIALMECSNIDFNISEVHYVREKMIKEFDKKWIR